MIEAYTLGAEGYSLATRLDGEEPAALPPFSDLTAIPASVWAQPWQPGVREPLGGGAGA